MDIASRENAGSEKTIHELGDLIQQITRHDKAEESREFASKMQTSLYSAAIKANPAVKNRGVKKAPFVVLIGATMPSILAEIGFVSNTKEENLLKRPDHRQRLAEALYRGLSRYAETLSHFQVAAKD
jgi:N-acetylmuramoyl-L-alanine amidase